jgi:hypothetical protein
MGEPHTLKPPTSTASWIRNTAFEIKRLNPGVSSNANSWFAGNHDLVAMRQLPKPGIEIPDLRLAPAEEREIAGMDQHIAGGDKHLAMQSVSVRHADDLQGCF